jgi:hypothetical protein
MRTFTFPDPALFLVRRFDPQQIVANGSAPGGLAIIDLPSQAQPGDTITVAGNCSAMGGLGGHVSFSTNGGDFLINVTGTGAFSAAVMLSYAADYISFAPSYSVSATFTSLTVDLN